MREFSLISLLEVARRAYDGPRMDEMDWNKSLFRTIQTLVAEHKLGYQGPELYLGVGDSYTDRLFQAAADLVSSLGVYCVSTNRVINFSKEEVLDAATEAPQEVIVGEGRDARTVKKRLVEDRRKANVIVGGHAPWRQEDAVTAQAAYASVARGDLIEGFNMLHCDGYDVHGLPMAVHAAKREAEMMREAVRQAGRPGMAITLYPILTSSGPMIAPSDPEQGLRRTDGLLLSILPDMKVEADYIANAIHYERYGGYKVNGGCYTNVGGFCGGVEGATVEVVAKALAAWLVYRDQMQYNATVFSQSHLTESRWHLGMEDKPTEDRMTVPLWATYAVNRALERNTNIIRFGGHIIHSGRGGIGSEADLLSVSKAEIVNTVMGLNLNCIITYNATPYHARFRAEVSDATVDVGLKREEAPRLLKELDSAINARLAGRSYPQQGDRRMLVYVDYERYYGQMKEAYDFARAQPSKQFMENAIRARKTLKDLGLNMKT